MKEFIFLLRSKPLTPQQLLAVQPKWTALIPNWATQGNYVESYVLANEGCQIIGLEKIISEGAVFTGNEEVLSVLIIRAENREQAMALAKECPTLESGGSVEIREVLPKPASNPQR